MNDANIIAAARLLTAAVAELEAAKAATAEMPPPPFGTRSIPFERVCGARTEVEEQLRNVKNCCYFASRAP